MVTEYPIRYGSCALTVKPGYTSVQPGQSTEVVAPNSSCYQPRAQDPPGIVHVRLAQIQQSTLHPWDRRS